MATFIQQKDSVYDIIWVDDVLYGAFYCKSVWKSFKYGCAVFNAVFSLWLSYDVEKGAGTMNPATFLRALGPEPWKVAYEICLEIFQIRLCSF